MTYASRTLQFYPRDKNGVVLRPLDIVIMGDIPEHYYADIDEESSAALKKFAGGYGLISYSGNEPFYGKGKFHPGWTNQDATVVNVLSHAINGDHVSSYEFWLPANSVERIPYNLIIMNLFSEYPWEMNEDDGPGSYRFIREGMPQFEMVRLILTSTYDDLVSAHNGAMRCLDKGVQER